MKNFFQKNKNYILAFLIPFMILCAVFLCLFILVPHGNSILQSDMEVQYNSLFTYLKDHGFETFSFQKGLGGNMIGTFAYYLSSPFNVIAFLFPSAKMDLALLLILTLKISLSGFTMYLFLSHQSKSKNKSYLLMFSTSYALMGYVVAYFFNIMWLDAIYILPCVILGIQNLFHDKKFLYVFSLWYAIITNYYMGYMICIFSLLYFVYYVLVHYNLKNDKKKIYIILKRFIILSLLSVGMSLFLLLPTVLELSKISKNNISPFTNSIQINSIQSLISFIFMGSRNSSIVLSDKVYNIYIGLINLILLYFYFINKEIPKKEKILSFSMICIFLVSILINYIDYVWHAFTETSSFSARFIFLLSFFTITLSAKSFEKIKNIKKEHCLIFLIIFMILSVLTMLPRYSYINNYLLIINNILIIFYLILLYNLKIKEKRKLITFLILLLTFGELFFNFYISIRSYKFMTRYQVQDVYNTFNNEVEKLKEEDKDFYRIEKNYSQTTNDAFRYDMYSNYLFLSTTHNKTLNFLGYASYYIGKNFSSYFKANPVIDTILGNKYIFSKDVPISYYDSIGKMQVSNTNFEYYGRNKSDVYIYKNENAFSLGTLVDERTKTCNIKYNDKSLDRLKFQNDMIECLTGEKSTVFEKIELEKLEKNKFRFFASGQKKIYLVPKIAFNFDEVKNKVKLKVNGKELYSYNEASVVISDFSIDSKKDIEIVIELSNDGDIDKEYEIYAYYFNFDEFKQKFAKFNSNKMKILENNRGYIKGEVNVLNKNYLFLNTEYTDEWEILVDGKKTNYDEVFNTFVGIKLDKGFHTVELIFHPKGWRLGILLSTFSFILTIYYFKKKK